MADRLILHCDCNAFFASVEMLDNPSLRGRPMAVAGERSNRHGIILAKNPEAAACGIKTAETVGSALSKCPGLTLVPPRHARYSEISKAVNRIYLSYTDLVDPFGIDESFLDLTGSLRLFPMPPLEFGNTLRERVKKEIGITISVGVSFCRAFAKLGSDYKKPDATTVISRENYREIVWPLPVSALLYVGQKTALSLNNMGIFTIGDLAAADRLALSRRLGEAGDVLYRYANGMDREEVRSYFDRQPPKSVGNGMTFRRDIVGREEILSGVTALCDEIAFRLREAGLKCRVVQVQVKDPAFHTVGRQVTLGRLTWIRKDLVESAMKLIGEMQGFGKTVRSITVTASGLVTSDEAGEQLDMFNTPEHEDRKQEEVEETLHTLRQRFGPDSIRLGCYENAEIGTGQPKFKKKETLPEEKS